MSRNILFAFALFYCSNSIAQVMAQRELVFPQVGWTLIIPDNSEFLTSSQFDSLLSATKKKADLNFELTDTDILFIVKENDHNYFASSVALFDSTIFKSWESSYANYKKIIVDVIESNKAVISLLDSASSTENIGGSVFQKLYLKTGYPMQDVIMESYWYYRKQGSIEHSINIAFTNKDIGEMYLATLRASKFDR